MFSGSNIMITGGTFNYQKRTSREGMDILLEWVETGAFHNSDELYDAPNCHPHTRVAVLNDIMKWVGESESVTRDDFMMWLFGPAGAGKSAIAKRIAELAAERDFLIATFFFSRASPTRSNKDRLIATLAYQLALSIPDTWSYIEKLIEQDPTIFRKNIQTQIETLLIKPLQFILSTQTVLSQKLIIIDGVDECHDSKAQVAIIEAISHSFTRHKLPILFLLVSRPEPDLDTAFNCNEPLRYIHRRLALDNNYRPDDDIRLFFSDKFEHIKHTHRLRSAIPTSWPSQETLRTLVAKSSGQFIYASTVVNFVESSYHNPSTRLRIILGISPPGKTKPFAELDALYSHLLSTVDDIQHTLRILSLYVMTPTFASRFRYSSTLPGLLLSLDPEDIKLAIINLPSILTYDESFGMVNVLHASLVDFLSDKDRSATFYIDMASVCTDFVRYILEFVKGPDGIEAGDVRLFRGLNDLSPYVPKGRLRNEILNFDLDAFINVFSRWKYGEHMFLIPGSTIVPFDIWKKFLDNVDLDDGDKKQARDRLNKSLASRLQIYQSDWRLQLLLTLTVTEAISYSRNGVSSCRYLDIFLDMLDDHDLHLVDQDALDLRHAYGEDGSKLTEMISESPYVDGDRYASAALYCMRFLSNPPKYSKNFESPGTGLVYTEWMAMCDMILEVFWMLLQEANTSPELVQYISNHDIYPAIQKYFSDDNVWGINACILSFLSRANVCPKWRIISAIQRSLIITHRQPSSDYARSESSDDGGTWHKLIRQRVDKCCSKVHPNHASGRTQN